MNKSQIADRRSQKSGGDRRLNAALRAVRAEIRKVAKMSPSGRWNYFFHLGNFDDLEDRGRVWICKHVWNAATCTADEFCRYCLAKVESWVLPVLRELIVKPPHGGPMSITKLRALDARIKREAKAAERRAV